MKHEQHHLTLFVLLLIASIVSFSCNKGTNKDKVSETKRIKTTEKTSSCNTKSKWIEYRKETNSVWDIAPYDNCYIIIEDSIFSYYREGILLQKRTMVKDGYFYFFIFKEKPEDHITFDEYNNIAILSRDGDEGTREYFELDKEYDDNSQ